MPDQSIVGRSLARQRHHDPRHPAARAGPEQRIGVAVERGPLQRFGAKGPGTSVYFRDPDGSLMEFMSYGDGK